MMVAISGIGTVPVPGGTKAGPFGREAGIVPDDPVFAIKGRVRTGHLIAPAAAKAFVAAPFGPARVTLALLLTPAFVMRHVTLLLSAD
jgi:hypothetical protein